MSSAPGLGETQLVLHDHRLPAAQRPERTPARRRRRPSGTRTPRVRARQPCDEPRSPAAPRAVSSWLCITTRRSGPSTRRAQHLTHRSSPTWRRSGPIRSTSCSAHPVEVGVPAGVEAAAACRSADGSGHSTSQLADRRSDAPGRVSRAARGSSVPGSRSRTCLEVGDRRQGGLAARARSGPTASSSASPRCTQTPRWARLVARRARGRGRARSMALRSASAKLPEASDTRRHRTRPSGSRAASRVGAPWRPTSLPPCPSSWSPTRPPRLPADLAEEQGIVVVPLQVVIGAAGARRGLGGGDPERSWRRRCATSSRSARRGPRRPRCVEVYERLRARGRRRDRVDPPVRGDERDLRVGAARGAAGRRARALRRLPPGGGGDRLRRAVGGGGAAVPAAPAPRRPRSPGRGPPRRRRCSTSTRWSTCAAAAGSGPPPRSSAAPWRSSRCCASRTARSPTSSGCGPPPVRSAGWRTSRSRRRASRRSTSASRTWPTPTGPRPLADKLAVRLADQLEGREVWCGELGAVLGAHVGPGMVAVCVAPR